MQQLTTPSDKQTFKLSKNPFLEGYVQLSFAASNEGIVGSSHHDRLHRVKT